MKTIEEWKIEFDQAVSQEWLTEEELKKIQLDAWKEGMHQAACLVRVNGCSNERLAERILEVKEQTNKLE